MPFIHSTKYPRVVRLTNSFVLGCLAVVSVACSNDLPTANLVQPKDALWKIVFSQKSLTMAVGERQTLTVTPLNILGEPISVPDTNPIVVSSSDTTRVMIDHHGEVRAIASTFDGFDHSLVTVTATWTYGDVSSTSTLAVAVTDTAPTDPVAVVSIQPEAYPADSTWTGYYTARFFMPTVKTTTGNVVPNTHLYMYDNESGETLTPFTSSIWAHFFIYRSSKVWMIVDGMVYGTRLRDSVEFLVMDPNTGTIQFLMSSFGIAQALFNSKIDTLLKMAPCGEVTFENTMDKAVSVTFDDPNSTSVCIPGSGEETGNITLAPGTSAIRKFARAGRYGWKASLSDDPTRTIISAAVRVRDHTQF